MNGQTGTEIGAPAMNVVDVASAPATGWRRWLPKWWRNRPEIPQELTAVAFVFAVEGAIAGFAILTSLMQLRLNLNFGVFGLGIGYGLLYLNQSSHKWAKRFLWFAIISIPIFALMLAFAPDPVDFRVFGEPSPRYARPRAWIMIVLLFAQTVWQLRVLRSPHVEELFRTRSLITAAWRARRKLNRSALRASAALARAQRQAPARARPTDEVDRN